MDPLHLKDNIPNNLNRDSVRPDLFCKIRCMYITDFIYNYLEVRRFLQIFRYNKNHNLFMYRNANDYRNFVPNNYPIELDIFTAPNTTGKFINIRQNQEKYFRIYFNNSYYSTECNYLKEPNIIRKIKIFILGEIKDFRALFEDCNTIEYIKIVKWKRSDIKDLSRMFYKCKSLKYMDLRNMKTENVKTMTSMFYGCSNLQTADLSKLDVRNLEDIEGLFYSCSALSTVKMFSFLESSINNINFLFCYCFSLKTLILKDFWIGNYLSINHVFLGCPAGLIELFIKKYKCTIDRLFL